MPVSRDRDRRRRPWSRLARTSTRPPAGVYVERVPEEVGEHLRDAVGIDLDGQRRAALHRERHALLVELRPQPLGAGRDELAEVDDPQVELDRALLGARELGEVRGEPLQPGRLLPDGDEHLLVRLEHAVEHAFDVALDRRQRRAHLVGDLRDRAAPGAAPSSRARRRAG